MTVAFTTQGSGPGIGTKEGPVVAAGMGTLSVTNSSALISTMTGAPNSGPLPTTPILLHVKNWAASGGEVYFFPFGGTAVDTGGMPLAPGDIFEIALGDPTVATIIAGSTATVTFQW